MSALVENRNALIAQLDMTASRAIQCGKQEEGSKAFDKSTGTPLQRHKELVATGWWSHNHIRLNPKLLKARHPYEDTRQGACMETACSRVSTKK